MSSKETIRQKTKPIPVRSGLSYRQFAEEHLFPNQPVVLEDGLRQWPALGKWTPEFFRQRYPGRRLTIDRKEWTMESFIDAVLNSGPGRVAPYFRNERVREVFPDLLPDLAPMPSYIQPNWLRGPLYPSAGRDAEIYIGGASAGFPFLHYDANSTHAFLCQVYGDKEAILYSPDDTEFVYAKSDAGRRHQSVVTDVENPDYTTFPKFAQATAWRGVLKPGCLLFIPNRWWHTARMLSGSITISYNVANASNWANLTDEVCYKVRGKQPVFVPFAAAYLKLLGWGQGAIDAVTGPPR